MYSVCININKHIYIYIYTLRSLSLYIYIYTVCIYIYIYVYTYRYIDIMCRLYYHFNNLRFNSPLTFNDFPMHISSVSCSLFQLSF